jgi:heat shock protein HslJ
MSMQGVQTMSRSCRLVFLVVGIVFILAACGSSSPTASPAATGTPAPLDTPEETPVPPTESPAATAEPAPTTGLAGTSWKLMTSDGTTVPKGVEITAEFRADGALSGSGGCNTYTAAYTLTGESITIENIASTMMACDDPKASAETAYLGALEKVSTWTIDGTSLTLTGPDGQPTLVYAKAFKFGGTSWQLATIDGAEVAAVVTATLQFGEDGQVSGSGGCNTYGGPFTVKGHQIDIGPLISTRMACPAAQTAVETAFLGGLEEVVSWKVGGGRLTLLGPKGKPTLVFDRPQ